MILGVVPVDRAGQRDEEAAPAFAHVIQANGALADAARRSLRAIYDRRPGRAAQPFADYVASLKWTRPAAERPAAAATVAADRYAGSSACRQCHEREYESWQTTGMAKMFRPYRAGDLIGDFSGSQTVSDQARPLTDGGKPFIEIRNGETWTGIRWITSSDRSGSRRTPRRFRTREFSCFPSSTAACARRG